MPPIIIIDMKRSLLLAAIALTITASAQEAPSISSAKIALDKLDLVSAKSYIDDAKVIIDGKPASEVKSKNMSKYHYYRGNVYYALYTSETPGNADYLDETVKSYTNLIAFEASLGKERYADNIADKMPMLAQEYVNRAETENFDNKDKGEARLNYSKAFELRGSLGQVDSTSLSYMAYLSQDMEDWTEAERIYLILIGMNYKNMTWSGMLAKDSVRYPFPDKRTLDMYVLTGEAFEPQRSESTEHDLYIQLLWVYSESDQKSKYDSLITISRAKYPENENLLKMELQSYLEKEDYAGALKNLKEAIVKNPNSALYLYNAGYIYHQQMKDLENGKAYYELAVTADPKYLDAVYMLGLMEIDASNVWVQKINKLGRSENSKAKSYTKEKEKALGRALVYFEKAYSIDNKDEATLKALREVYYKLTRYDDVKRVTEEMQQI